MAEIFKYALVDDRGLALDEREWDALWEAKDAARGSNCAVVRRIYTYEDEELVWTPNGSDTWPPDLPTLATATAGGPDTDLEEQP